MARRPSAYPPPVKVGEFVQTPEAGEDERIDVGVAFVGAGPAGLAGAIRLAQLLESDPATAERLGETPIAVLDKGRVAGAHLLSGAVVNPSALRDLLPGEDVSALPGCFGPVTKEAVYLMTKGSSSGSRRRRRSTTREIWSSRCPSWAATWPTVPSSWG